jgi:hypothetical protein
MNEQDKEHMRILFAGFAMLGLISRGSVWDFKEAWEMADGMLEAKDKQEPEIGIVAAKTRRRK